MARERTFWALGRDGGLSEMQKESESEVGDQGCSEGRLLEDETRTKFMGATTDYERIGGEQVHDRRRRRGEPLRPWLAMVGPSQANLVQPGAEISDQQISASIDSWFKRPRPSWTQP